MSYATLVALSGDEVQVIHVGDSLQLIFGLIPNENRVILPRDVAERLHAALGEALAANEGRG